MVNTIKVVCFSNATTIIKVLEVEPNKMFRFPEGTYYWCYIPVTESKNPIIFRYYDINFTEQDLWDITPLSIEWISGDEQQRYCVLETYSNVKQGDYKYEEDEVLYERFKEYSDWDREYTSTEGGDDHNPDKTVFLKTIITEGKGYDLTDEEVLIVEQDKLPQDIVDHWVEYRKMFPGPNRS
jgi:hypothetical protein